MWIKTSEQLPRVGELVLGYSVGAVYRITYCYMDADKSIQWAGGAPTHWHALPVAPIK